MNANPNEDSYDELLILARDAKSTRKRANRWTTGLVITGMAASFMYVATVNQQLNALQEEATNADQEHDQADEAQRAKVARLESELNSMRSERDAYENVAEWFSKMVPELTVADSIKRIIISTGRPGQDGQNGQDGRNDFALSNLVWYVDGSRRFPVADKDILWIPEGQFWVQLRATSANVAPTNITVHLGDRPPSDPDVEDNRPLFNLARPETPANAPYPYYQRQVDRGAMNCVQIRIEPRTERPAFGNGYSDMIVTYLSLPVCGNGLGPPPPPPPPPPSE